jgi:hypothetical protein
MIMTLRDKAAPPVYLNTVWLLDFVTVPGCRGLSATGAAIAAVATGAGAGTGAGHGLAPAGKAKSAKALLHFTATCRAGRHWFGETAQSFKLGLALLAAKLVNRHPFLRIVESIRIGFKVKILRTCRFFTDTSMLFVLFRLRRDAQLCATT